MANPLAKSLIGIVAALVAAGSVSAQEDLFNEAVRKLRTNKPDEALAKLQEYLATNPGNEEAFDLWKKTDAAVFQALVMQGGEFETIANHLMTIATMGRREISRDMDTIRGLVDTATSGGDYGARMKAISELVTSHSEFAVPALLEKLGNADDDQGQNYGLLALSHIGSPAVMPLVEALSSDDELLRRNIAAALVHIGDKRAAAALAKLASADSSEAVRDVARAGLANFGVAAGASPVDIYTRDARDYLTGVGLRGLAVSEVVWSWGDGALVAQDVPAQVYHLELAKKAAHEAMRLDPANDDAKTLLARSYLAQSAAIKDSLAANPDDEGLQALAAKIPSLNMVAMTTGPDTLRRALTESISDQMFPAAVAAIEALGNAESRDSLNGSPLLAAVTNDDASVGYAAALAVTKIAGGSANVPNSADVVAVLGRAVNEQGRRLIHIVGGGDIAMRAAKNASSGKGGTWVNASSNAQTGIAAIYGSPDFDIVIVNETLTGGHPRDVISLVRKNSPNAKILLATSNEEKASENYDGIVDGFIASQLTGEILEAKANELVEVFDPRRAKANEVAVAASNALHKLASSKIDVGAALESLQNQLQRNDAVAIPAAGALGQGGNEGNLGALGAILGGDGSVELKTACANAIGAILSRSASVPTECFEALSAIANDANADAGLRAAAVTALGKGKLAPGERLKLAELLRTVAAAGDEL